ncbi:MAG: hypothetical protein FJ086_07080 [Deltaproteobacteria bacterium]|nr:hypothetical protein [Deltaproteobacteria bacterium]
MRAERLVLPLLLVLAAPAAAARLLPNLPPDAAPPTWVAAPATSPEPPRFTRSQRLLGESLAAVGLGVVAPFSAWLASTASGSFQGFFTGVASASLLGWVGGPLAVILTGRWLGAGGNTWRAVVGSLAGLLVGLVVGGVLATAPSAAYLAGLGILWAAPAAGALVGMEWGRGESPPPSGALVLRF